MEPRKPSFGLEEIGKKKNWGIWEVGNLPPKPLGHPKLRRSLKEIKFS